MRNNDVVIQKADKGNTVVLCDKAAYIDRMKELINDDTKFTDLNKLPSEWLSFVVKMNKRCVTSCTNTVKQTKSVLSMSSLTSSIHH